MKWDGGSRKHDYPGEDLSLLKIPNARDTDGMDPVDRSPDRERLSSAADSTNRVGVNMRTSR